MQAIASGNDGGSAPARGPVAYAPGGSGNGHAGGNGRVADGSVVKGRTYASGVSGGV